MRRPRATLRSALGWFALPLQGTALSHAQTQGDALLALGWFALPFQGKVDFQMLQLPFQKIADLRFAVVERVAHGQGRIAVHADRVPVNKIAALGML